MRRLCGQIHKPAEKERSARLGGIELAFRDHIHEVLIREVGDTYWRQAMPPDVLDDALKKATRDLGVSSLEDVPPRRLLDFCYLSDYEKVINRNWRHFEDTFGRKAEFRHYMRSINEFRNHVMHFKPIEGLVAAEGEMAVIWLEATLPSFQDPAQEREQELSEEDFDDDDEELEAWSDQRNWEYWKSKCSRKILSVTGKLIELVTSVGPDIEPQFLKRYIGFSINGTANNFAILFPKQGWVRVGVRVPESTEDIANLEKAGLEMMSYNKKRGRVRFRVRESDLLGATFVIEELMARAYADAIASQPTDERGRFQWDEQSFMDRIEQQDGKELRDVAKSLLAWCEENANKIRWGRSQENGDGSFIPKFFVGERKISLFAVRTGGGPGKAIVSVYFGDIRNLSPYETREARLGLLTRLNELPGVDLAEGRAGKYPHISLGAFQKPAVVDRFLEIMLEVVDTIRTSN